MKIILSPFRTKFRLTMETYQIITSDTGMSVDKLKQTQFQDLNIYYAKDYLRNINMSFTDCLLSKFKNIKKHVKKSM